MNKLLVGAGVAAVAVFAGVIWFARQPDHPPAGPTAAPPGTSGATPPSPLSQATPPRSADGRVPLSPVKHPAAIDPRLKALIGPPDDAMVEYRADRDGRVIQEIDNDPNSPRYRETLREYTYAGDQLATVTVYRHLGGQVQVIRALASYRPDGSVDHFEERTEYRKP